MKIFYKITQSFLLHIPGHGGYLISLLFQEINLQVKYNYLLDQVNKGIENHNNKLVLFNSILTDNP